MRHLGVRRMNNVDDSTHDPRIGGRDAFGNAVAFLINEMQR